eukprot:6188403-Pleurochrysis_carterae.AAC.1
MPKPSGCTGTRWPSKPRILLAERAWARRHGKQRRRSAANCSAVQSDTSQPVSSRSMPTSSRFRGRVGRRHDAEQLAFARASACSSRRDGRLHKDCTKLDRKADCTKLNRKAAKIPDRSSNEEARDGGTVSKEHARKKLRKKGGRQHWTEKRGRRSDAHAREEEGK